MPADDYTDPAPFTTFTHLDATTELSRQIASLGIYPAVDPLASTSNILAPEIVGERHYDVARRVQGVLQRFRELQDIIAILGLDELSEEDRLIGEPGPQDPALPVAALQRGRGVHRVEGRDRAHPGDGGVLRGPAQRRSRRRSRAGLPQRGWRRVRAREGPHPRVRRLREADSDAHLFRQPRHARGGPARGGGRRRCSCAPTSATPPSCPVTPRSSARSSPARCASSTRTAPRCGPPCTAGFVQVEPDRVVVLAPVAERAADIDVERARRALEAAAER